MRKCERCGKWSLDRDTCACTPFEVFHEEELGDESERYWGYDFDDIAERYAEAYNEQENFVTCDNVFESYIKIVNQDGVEKFFNVYAEPEIKYYAEELANRKESGEGE